MIGGCGAEGEAVCPAPTFEREICFTKKNPKSNSLNFFTSISRVCPIVTSLAKNTGRTNKKSISTWSQDLTLSSVHFIAMTDVTSSSHSRRRAVRRKLDQKIAQDEN